MKREQEKLKEIEREFKYSLNERVKSIEEKLEKLLNEVDSLKRLPHEIMQSHYEEGGDNKKKTMQLLEKLYQQSEKEMTRNEWDKACEELNLSKQGASILFRWGYAIHIKANGKRVITQAGMEKVEKLQK